MINCRVEKMFHRLALVLLVSASLIFLTICDARETCQDPTCPSVADDEVEWGLTLLPAPSNCNEFFICNRGIPIRMFCPATLVFNPAINVCDYQRNAKCRVTCEPKDDN
ncbi:peritrophin-1-like [Phlebotomus papatasi]|uniref:peritrophin-1-like n=1 Tax=Phlebotomus papatasi TaxID=29031 RepID=UPI0024841AE6|nr:peritrophin-1-like [Phlebotomus papatasi]